MRIADISIRQPVFITMIIALIVVLGVVSYTRLGVDMMPDISLPIVVVTVVNPGVGPEEMEAQVSKPVEDVLSALNGIKNISSTSAESVAVIVAEFTLEKDAQQASTEVREKMTSIRNTLPREIQEPVIDKFDVSASTVVSYTITSKGQRLNLMELRALVEDRIVQQVASVDNVGSVTVLGGLEREIHVDVDVDKLNALGLSIAQVSQAIRGENLNFPAGKVTQKDFDFILRTNEEFEKVVELQNIIVATPQGTPVYLKDVALVSDNFKKRQAISRVNGIECVSMVVRKQSGTNSVAVADGVNKMMARVRKNYPNLEIRLATDESVAIKESRDDVINSLILGALLAGIVVLFSFGDLRNTLITIAGLPVCIIGSFAVMALLGFSINVLTLLALSLSVGLLIDDAIVVRENIFRHMEKLGKDARTAASDGTSEVALAVTATTFTLVAVFLPVAFATGIAGKFFRQFGITVTAAVLISYFEAFTFAPMLSAYFFKKTKAGSEHSFSSRFQAAIARFYDRLGQSYRPVLKWSIGHRTAIVFVTLAVFAASLFLFTVVGVGGSPRGQRPEFNLVIQCTPGSSLQSTERVVSAVEKILHQQKEIGDVFSIIGTKDGASDEASINIKLLHVRDNKAFQDHLRPFLAGIPGAAITFQDVMTLGGAAASSLQQLPIQVNLKGTNLKSLTRAAEMVKDAIRTVPGLVDINSDYRNPKPEIQVQVDRDRAARLGANTLQIASTMRTFVDGDIASRFRTPERMIDIRVRALPATRESLDRLARVFIPTVSRGSVTLDQVAKLNVETGPSQIKRKNRMRQIVVGGNMLKGVGLNDLQAAVQTRLQALALPGDVAFTFGGQVEQNSEMFATLIVTLILAIVFVYMILASQFASFVQPFALMLALPLSLIGAVLGLLLAGKLFDIVAFIGLIMLMGLVTKNSILLIDYTNVLRRRGLNRSEAIIEAGATRLRPILMTSLAMILGMLPVAFGLGTSSDFRKPIGFTIIGGLISSTILTLVVVPVVYSLLDDLTQKFSRKKTA
jgi:hydrophobe/amphiphile efflux-1 (HAE1) family protein